MAGRALGLAPVAPPPHAFAVDGAELRYAGFRRDGEVWALARTAAVPLAPDTFAQGLLGGPVKEPGVVRAAVESLLAEAGGPVREASLVVPDAWLRVAFTDVAELPAGAAGDDVLRWKLKRLVPFRVDELRLSAVEVAPLPEQSTEEPHRVLLGFAIEQLLAELEDAFEAAGVRLGRVTNAGLATLAALARPVAPGGEGGDLEAVARVEREGYTLAFARAGEPVLYRYKSFAESLPPSALGGFIHRDLRLTRSFLAEQLPAATLSRIVVAAPPEDEPSWVEWLEGGLEARAEPLRRDHLPPVEAGAPAPSWRVLAPLLGAARQEVA
ncbi:MAG TPA: hypothetical protein VHQ65_00615 [Thermoanaerobaculia bacterium]|nr:hypothetical protein [Thermoanaerobaculia bacterium]